MYSRQVLTGSHKLQISVLFIKKNWLIVNYLKNTVRKMYVGWVGFLLALVFTLNTLSVSGMTCRTPNLVQGV